VNLSNHLFRNTCLLVGLSLEDVTLQSLLRQNAVANPGNVHYVIHFQEAGNILDAANAKIVFEANFNSYNLYTLFLDNAGIRDLADLISISERSFELHYSQTPVKFVYYLIGAIGAGKSTAADHFRNLITYDEWIDERQPETAVPENTLGVWSRALMVHYFLLHGGMHFGPSSSRQRHHDRGDPSSDTA
jgi:hypothetical protein